MPEYQNVVGDEWTNRLNNFLRVTLKWEQHGESNTDIFCEHLKRKVGIDSVFSYRRNKVSHQQVVLIEAKTIEKIENLSRSKIENWIVDFQEKIACVPHSQEFIEKFNADENADYQLGLLALWVRDTNSYSQEKIQTWLSQLNLPTRRQNPICILFVSNRVISSFCAIDETIKHLSTTAGYKAIKYHFPTYGALASADGSCIPAEILLSKFVFCDAVRTQIIKGKSETSEYQSKIVFYLGDIQNYSDLRFIGLALLHFQFLANQDIDIYTKYDPVIFRNEIKIFEKEFSETGCNFRFIELKINDKLPGWLAYD